jgi:hypothetical protein
VTSPKRFEHVKTVSVRISAEQAKQLQSIATDVPGMSLNLMVQRGVDLFLEIEGPVHLAKARELRNLRKRQDVRAA